MRRRCSIKLDKMMKYSIIITNTAQLHFKVLKTKHQEMLEKVKLLVDGILVEPRTGIGKPERLRHYVNREVWSRRIDKKNRIVYEIRDNTIIILSVFGHYDD